MSKSKTTPEKTESDEELLLDALDDLANHRDISIYHYTFEATVNLSDIKGQYLLQALHESGFEVINETDNIYTLRYSSENGLKPNSIEMIHEAIEGGD